jgi:hypothetical protein
MTRLLKQAYDRIAQLPEDEQDSIASRILDEIEDDAQWDRQFAASQEVLSELAKRALSDRRSGKTEPLDPDRL